MTSGVMSVTHSELYHVPGNLSLKGQHSKPMLGVLVHQSLTTNACASCLALQFLSSLTSHSVLTITVY